MGVKKNIDLSNFRGDFFGGITAGVVALPLALAFGVQSGMGAIAGIYGAIAIGVIASWFGGTPTQVSGPTGPMTVVSAVVIAKAIDVYGGSLELAMGEIIATFTGFIRRRVLRQFNSITGFSRNFNYCWYWYH